MDVRAALGWIILFSLLMFLGSLIILPIVIIQLPADYFVRSSQPSGGWRQRHPVLRLAGRILKNLVGLACLGAGLVMLLTPGQGILASLVGISLLDFPGKRALELRLIALPHVHRLLNRIRKKAGRPPLQIPSKTNGMSEHEAP